MQGVVFDFDGVIADTERLHLAAYQQVFARRGWHLDETSYFERYLGVSDAILIRMFARDRGLSLSEHDERTFMQEKMHAYLEVLREGNCLYPGAVECIRDAARQYPLAIASGSLRAEILHILDGNGLTDAFQAIVSAENVTRSKPAPDPYLAAARSLDLAADACLAIEDSSRGVESARAAGMRTIGVTTSSTAEQLAAADLVLARIAEITPDVLGRVFALPALATRATGA